MECKYVGVRLRYIAAGSLVLWIGAVRAVAWLAQEVVL